MPLNRRSFLKGSAALGAGLGGFALYRHMRLLGERAEEAIVVSAAKSKSGTYMLVAVKPSGEILSSTPLPKRAHEALPMPHVKGNVLVFARRPDTFAMQINVVTGNVVKSFESQPGRHFFGHGALSDDGRYLFTSENDYENARGLVVVRDTQNFQVLEEYYSGGVGPHQLKLMSNTKQLVVANGGIHTHPDWPRMKLNIDTMASNLAYIDINSGHLDAQINSEHHQQSIRHIDVNHSGKVIVGVQYQGHRSKTLPLLYSHDLQRGEGELSAFKASSKQWQSMRQYTASICTLNNNAYVSCPRGEHVSMWDVNTHQFVEQFSMRDVAGVGLHNNTVLMSSGMGKVASLYGNDLHKNEFADILFDNHMAVMSV